MNYTVQCNKYIHIPMKQKGSVGKAEAVKVKKERNYLKEREIDRK